MSVWYSNVPPFSLEDDPIAGVMTSAQAISRL